MKKLEQFFIDKGSAKETQKHYKASVKIYEQINDLSLEELIEEADCEEEARIRWKNRKIKQRLINFRNYLFATYMENTAKIYLTDIKTIYRHFEIELQDLPSYNSRQINKTYEMSFEDLPKKEELIDAYYEANNLVKGFLTFAISTGLSKVDILKLTVQDFITACKSYLTETELLKQLLELKDQEEVIPCFIGTRQKTGKKYITFCSPEAVTHIVQYLLGRNVENPDGKLKLTDKLFDISDGHLSRIFRRINGKLGLGKSGNRIRFRPHMLRKWQASTLLNSETVQWTEEEIDVLQGRSKDKTHRAYFHNDTEKLRAKYTESVDDLMLFMEIHGVDEEAYYEMERENSFYKKEIVRNEKKLEEQQNTIDKIVENQAELKAMLGL